MNRIFRIAGITASIILIAFGAVSIVMGVSGHRTVQDNLSAEKIVGTPDMSPTATRQAVAAAKLQNVDVPSCDIADKAIANGADARCFAQYMRIHALEASGGLVYAQMGRYLDKAGKPTDDQKAAAVDPKTNRPVENGARNLWVTETALSTALNTSYFASNVALFAIVMGIALLLTGIGFLVLTLGLVAPSARKGEAVAVNPALAN